MRTLCDAYYEEHESHYRAFLDICLVHRETFSWLTFDCRMSTRPVQNLFFRFRRKPAVCVSPEYPVIPGSFDFLYVSFGNPVDWTHGIWSGGWTPGRI